MLLVKGQEMQACIDHQFLAIWVLIQVWQGPYHQFKLIMGLAFNQMTIKDIHIQLSLIMVPWKITCPLDHILILIDLKEIMSNCSVISWYERKEHNKLNQTWFYISPYSTTKGHADIDCQFLINISATRKLRALKFRLFHKKSL